MSGSVFVLDDDDEMRAVLEKLLSSFGYHVQAFCQATDFIKMHPHPISGCIIMDVRMPDLDGLTFQGLLREANIDLPVIFLSAYADVAASVRAMQQGAITFLVKPCRDHDLIDAVAFAMKHERETRKDRYERRRLRDAFSTLDERETGILNDVAHGRSSKIIAQRLGLSEVMVKVIRARIMRKMGAPTLVHLARFFEKLQD